jgi:hypothetical protein
MFHLPVVIQMTPHAKSTASGMPIRGPEGIKLHHIFSISLAKDLIASLNV